MDKNQITGLVLISVLLVVYFKFFAPEPTPPPTVEGTEQTTIQDSGTTEGEKTHQIFTKTDSLENLLNQEKYGQFGSALSGEDRDITIENEKVKITFNTKGGRIKEALIKDYYTFDKKPLIIFNDESDQIDLILKTPSGPVNLSDLYFTSNAQDIKIKEGENASVSFSVPLGNGQSITQTYTLAGDNYNIDYNLDMKGVDQLTTDNNLVYSWNDRLIKLEDDLKQSRLNTTINYFTASEDFEDLDKRSEGKQEVAVTEGVKWIGIKQKFFTSAIISKSNPFKNVILSTDFNEADTTYVKIADVNLQIPLSDLQGGKGNFTYYFGPNDFNVMKKVTPGFDKNVFLGWAIFRWINQYVIITIFQVLEKWIPNYGIIILILVLIIKIFLFPLSYKSYISMAKTKALKPELDEIKAQFPDNLQKQQAAQMELYQKIGINPLSGCVPVLLQLPVLYAMFSFFPNSIELRQKAFLWAPDLSTYDAFIHLSTTIPFLGNHISLFTLLMTASTFLYTWSNNQVSGAAAQGPMKTMTYLMPIVFMFVLNSYPAGLSYYYFCSQMVTFGQQMITRRFVDDKKIHEMLEKSKKRNKGKKSGFQQRIQEAMKAAQEQQQQRKNK
ncbi:membrane protein insertase YidC [Xanthovirga aplysinae]|uniref:membrane protein insertase YidC n=1 Tax=Xanthovirga aplysinae TaxID=2529853 RepID=UPI0012BBBBE4|nr:membrane protein insertase YidC [Xanthovirga aplysinae]MTI30562.1 membrane protein insertase YidC [Xanthovirga aplysinae]